MFAFVVFITAISESVTLMAIVFCDLSAKESVVAASVLLMASIGSFGIIRQMSTIKLLVDEMDDKTSKTMVKR